MKKRANVHRPLPPRINPMQIRGDFFASLIFSRLKSSGQRSKDAPYFGASNSHSHVPFPTRPHKCLDVPSDVSRPGGPWGHHMGFDVYLGSPEQPSHGLRQPGAPVVSVPKLGGHDVPQDFDVPSFEVLRKRHGRQPWIPLRRVGLPDLQLVV